MDLPHRVGHWHRPLVVFTLLMVATAVGCAVDEIHAEYRALDVVVANAGISVRHGVLDIDGPTARRIVEVNLLGGVGGLDLRRPAVKLPGLGRVGVPGFDGTGAPDPLGAPVRTS